MDQSKEPDVRFLLAKVARQTRRIRELQQKVEELEKDKAVLATQVQEAEVRQKIYEETLEAASTYTGGENRNNNGCNSVQKQGAHTDHEVELDEEPHHHSRHRRDTCSTTEARYTKLHQKFIAQTEELERARHTINIMRASQRKNSFEMWEYELVQERLRTIESYVESLEKREKGDDSTVAALMSTIKRMRDTSIEERRALKESRAESANLKKKMEAMQTQLSSVTNIFGLSDASQVTIAVENERKRRQILETLATKARQLLSTALSEREKMDQIFSQEIPLNSAVVKFNELGFNRSMPGIAEFLEARNAEMDRVRQLNELLNSEREDALRGAVHAIEACSEALSIPQKQRVQVATLLEAIGVLSKLAIASYVEDASVILAASQ